ncbi:MAG: ATP synthase F1 subunit delta [Candidatus Omnitrophica bacterium]|nr:ATP synthase F1 subunit delta [Candidatus Omnitrophota bacterium]
MKDLPVIRRYSEALYQLARDRNALERLGGDLEELAALFAQEEALFKFLTNPTLGREERRQWFRKNLGPHLAPVTRRFVEILVLKGRMDAFSEIHEAFLKRVRLAKGEIDVRVKSAVPLAKGLVKKLTQALEERLRGTVTLALEVDRRLLAGLVVEYENKVIDGSARSRLEEMRNQLLTVEA